MTTETLLVTGAAGHLGRLVVELLLERDQRVIATTRDPAKLADLAARGVDVRRANFDEPSTLPAAFAGATRALLVSTDSFDRPAQRIDQHRAAIAAFVAAGTKHVVYTSMPHPETSPCVIAPDHAATEAALVASSLDYTILRNSMFAEMLLYSLPGALAAGTLADAKNNAGMTYVTRADCARVAAGALIGARGRTIVDVTGPAAITSEQLAALASKISTRPLAYQNLPVPVLVEGMVAHGVNKLMAEVFASFDLAAVRGDFAVVTSAVRELGGCAPTTLETFLTANRAALL